MRNVGVTLKGISSDSFERFTDILQFQEWVELVRPLKPKELFRKHVILPLNVEQQDSVVVVSVDEKDGKPCHSLVAAITEILNENEMDIIYCEQKSRSFVFGTNLEKEEYWLRQLNRKSPYERSVS